MDTPNSVPSSAYFPVPHSPAPIPFPPGHVHHGHHLAEPSAFPQHFAFPEPTAIPWPDDWWTCWRSAPVSGRYEGDQAGGGLIGNALDLRLDVDPRANAESPVMNKVSGDFYSKRTVRSGGRAAVVKTYVESWIVDTPTVTMTRSSARITGAVRYWKGVHPPTAVEIVVSWSHGAITGAVATFTTGGTAGQPYACAYRSDSFRDVNLELDYCTSVDVEPKVPVYGSHSHNNRPADLPERSMTIESAYRDAGIAVTVDPAHTVINDSAPGFASWNVAELHDAMETSFSKFTSGWPAWNLWGVQAGRFDSAGVGGIMFDAAAGFGGSGEGPERQGFAVFRNHSWFANLVSGPPANQNQAWAMRHFLYTWVHEAGHAFNFLHAWDKARPDSLSWMNYDWKYDQRNGADSFWGNFRFRFDDDELLHMRHGDRASVIMGGDPWASGGHLESPPGAMTVSGPGSDLELTLSSKPHFDFMEPVSVEFRLRNVSDVPLVVDGRLDPRYGNTSVYVQKPNGTIVLHESVVCFYGLPEPVTLAPAAGDGAQGNDRYSQLVQLAYSTAGFTFNEPGQYLVRAVYETEGVVQASSTLPLRVGFPVTKEEDRFAPEFFTRAVGLTLAFEGSMSPFLAKGLETLGEAAERFSGEPLGAKSATAVAQSVGDDFFRRKEDKMVKHHSADPERALALTEPALAGFQKGAPAAANLDYRNLVELRTALHVKADDAAAAKSEVETLAKDLDKRGANRNVLAQVKELIPSAPATRTRRAAPRKPAK